MDRKQMCVSNVKYKKPTQNEAKRMKNLLKYLTYRDSRDDYVPQVSGVERWVDHGMGRSVTQIADTCEGYQSDHVLLFSLVVNPNPDLIRMIPHEEREAFVRQLTERTVEGFFDARGIDTGVEYSAMSRITEIPMVSNHLISMIRIPTLSCPEHTTMPMRDDANHYISRVIGRSITLTCYTTSHRSRWQTSWITMQGVIGNSVTKS